MKCKEFAELLLKTPDAQYLATNGDEWFEVCGVQPTGFHRNAVCAQVVNPHLGGGVIVVLPDVESPAGVSGGEPQEVK